MGAQHISFGHLTWRIGGKDLAAPTAAQLLALGEGDYAILRPPPSKADPFGTRWAPRPIYLPYHPTAAINAARQLAMWETIARVKPEARRRTPLFWGARATARAPAPLLQREIEEAFEGLAAYVLGAEEAKKYSLHSFRSYLACALMAAGCSDAQIQAALRWASDEALELYKRTSDVEYGGWLARAERQRLSQLQLTHHLPRALPRYESHDLAGALIDSRIEMAAEAARGGDDA